MLRRFLLAALLAPLIACGDQSPAPAREPEVKPDLSFVLLDDDRIYGDLAAAEPEIYADPTAPTWFLLRVDRGGMGSVPVAPPAEIDPDTPLTLDVVAYRTHTGPVAIDVTWGEVARGTLNSAEGVTGARLEMSIPLDAGALPPGTANLDLKDRSPKLPKPEAFDVSDHRGRIWIDSVRIGGPRGEATKDEPAPPRGLGVANADHVILATAPLVEPAERLAAHRRSQGLRATVVPIPADRAITQAEIRQLAASEGLRYLVLAGDATYDRTDLIDEPTIPTPMARTKYNGATSADPLYLPEGKPVSIGRLPFRTKAAMDAYVDRLIAYETKPPAHYSRRMLRFVTNEGRFGKAIDSMIENLFRRVLADVIAPEYEVEVTFASANSRFMWPPREMNAKVISSINNGALFFTYIGHGYQFGFDSLRVGGKRFPVLHASHVEEIDVKGTPPIAFIVACTTAQFDDPKHDGIGEALLKRPSGPIAYWGASRVCHPAANSLVGYTLAKTMSQAEPPERLGDLIREAWDAAALGGSEDQNLKLIRLGTAMMARGIKIDTLLVEGRQMYTLLGDPALKIAYPKQDIEVQLLPSTTDTELHVAAKADVPDGTPFTVSLEATRDKTVHPAVAVPNVLDPKHAPLIRENHRRANNWAHVRKDGVFQDGRAEIRFRVEDRTEAVIVKVASAAGGDVRHGALRIPAPKK